LEMFTIVSCIRTEQGESRANHADDKQNRPTQWALLTTLSPPASRSKRTNAGSTASQYRSYFRSTSCFSQLLHDLLGNRRALRNP
jgi:hypothetical protein